MTSSFYLINYVPFKVSVSSYLLSWLQIGCYATELIWSEIFSICAFMQVSAFKNLHFILKETAI